MERGVGIHKVQRTRATPPRHGFKQGFVGKASARKPDATHITEATSVKNFRLTYLKQRLTAFSGDDCTCFSCKP